MQLPDKEESEPREPTKLPGLTDDLRLRFESVAEGLISTRKQTKAPASYVSKKDLQGFSESKKIDCPELTEMSVTQS